MEKKIETKESESQTDILLATNANGTNNTDTKSENDSNNDKLDIHKNTNREIRPKDNETIVEMRIGHDDLDEENVERYILKSLKLSLIGKPWIANNGRHFVNFCKLCFYFRGFLGKLLFHKIIFGAIHIHLPKPTIS